MENPTTQSKTTAQQGSVTLMGAGPGDPDLLTLKAIKALRTATVVFVDDLVSEDCLRFVRKSARIIYVGKRGGCVSTPQAFIEKRMIFEAQSGERVVRLKGGDPMIFGRAGEELSALRAAGVSVDVINGITSAIAAATSVGASLTHRDCAHGVMFVSAHLKDGSFNLPWAAMQATGMTMALYMGVSHAQALQTELLAANMPANTPVAIVERASTNTERQHFTTLAGLAHTIHSQSVQSPAMILVGEAMRHAVNFNATPYDSVQSVAKLAA